MATVLLRAKCGHDDRVDLDTEETLLVDGQMTLCKWCAQALEGSE